MLDDDQLMLVTDAGKIIRIRVDGGEGDSIRVAGRKTQGVRLFEIGDDETVMSVGVIKDADDDDNDDDHDNAITRDDGDGETGETAPTAVAGSVSQTAPQEAAEASDDHAEDDDDEQ